MQFLRFRPLDRNRCLYWASMEYWLTTQALLLSIGYDPHGSYTLGDSSKDDGFEKVGNVELFIRRTKLERAKNIGECIPGKYPGEYLTIYSPLSFSEWGLKHLPSFHDELYEVVKSLKTVRSKKYVDVSDLRSELPGRYLDTLNPQCIDDVLFLEQFGGLSEAWTYFEGKFVPNIEIDSHYKASSGNKPTKGVAGATARWTPKGDLEKVAIDFMRKLLTIGCRCRHNKLAKITYELATGPDGLVLRSHDKKNMGLLKAITREAKKIVPPERRFGRTGVYNKEKCVCPITEHELL